MRVIWSVTLLVVTILGIFAFVEYKFKADEIESRIRKHNQIYAFLNGVNNDNDIRLLQDANTQLKELNLDNTNEIESVLKLKMAISCLNKAESNIAKVREMKDILQAANPTNYPFNNPLLIQLLQEARNKYEESRQYIDTINYDGNENFNYSFYYVKGCIYFRYLQIMATNDNAEEVFAQSLSAFKNALKHKPKDINAEINIELLLKKKDEMFSNAKKPGDDKIQQLPGLKAGNGTGKGKF